MMPKATIVRDSNGLFYGIKILCPAEKYYQSESFVPHIISVNWLPPGETQESPHVKNASHWEFNGDFERPVFSPSLLTRLDSPSTGIRQRNCHSFIGCNGAQPGQIIFLGDCTHDLAGKVVDLPDISEKD
jgi:hypothetical protein